jgi:mannose-6-phosphate isomerase-like protein (cupin superfamily)
MKLFPTLKHRGRFEVLVATRGAQAAMMTLRPGDASADAPHNEHPHSEQWLFVISGSGEAVMRKGRSTRRAKIREHDLLVIEKGELHQIKNTGRKALVTVNLYVPPAYDKDGEPR